MAPCLSSSINYLSFSFPLSTLRHSSHLILYHRSNEIFKKKRTQGLNTCDAVLLFINWSLAVNFSECERPLFNNVELAGPRRNCEVDQTFLGPLSLLLISMNVLIRNLMLSSVVICILKKGRRWAKGSARAEARVKVSTRTFSTTTVCPV